MAAVEVQTYPPPVSITFTSHKCALPQGGTECESLLQNVVSNSPKCYDAFIAERSDSLLPEVYR